MSEEKPVRIYWTVTLLGPRASDNPEHSVSGSGESPEAALYALKNALGDRADLIESFYERLNSQ